MSTARTSTGDPSKARSLEPLFWSACFAALVAFVLLHAERGAISPSTMNPAGVGAPRPVEPLFPNFDMVFWGQVMAVLLAVGLVVGFILKWRRHPKHPFLLMMLASTSVCWLDPINNWSIYLVYNPKLWHFPQDWPWVGLSPIIEPVMNFVYAPYILVPYLLSIAVLRRLQARSPMTSLVCRRPMLSLALITIGVTFLWDSLQEIFLVATQFYVYTHVMPFGSIFAGKTYQFPLLMASGLISIVMIPTTLLMYRDDTGLTQAEKLAKGLKLYRTRPGTATFLVMAGALNLSFMIFISTFYAVRVTGMATSVACPWPYPESVVFDPNGFYEREGQQGPFWEGRMNGRLSGLPEGRPADIHPISDRCVAP